MLNGIYVDFFFIVFYYNINSPIRVKCTINQRHYKEYVMKTAFVDVENENDVKGLESGDVAIFDKENGLVSFCKEGKPLLNYSFPGNSADKHIIGTGFNDSQIQEIANLIAFSHGLSVAKDVSEKSTFPDKVRKFKFI